MNDGGRKMLEQDTFIVPEYRLLLQRVPIDQKRIYFRHFIDLEVSEIHPRIRMLKAMIATVKELDNPSRRWWHAIGQLSFTTAEYDLLLKLAKEYPHVKELTPFVARMHVYRNNFKQALHLCQLQFDALKQLGQKHGLMDTLLIIETYFTLGVTKVYLREFEETESIINQLYDIAKSQQIRDFAPKELLLRIKLQITVLSAMRLLFMGHVESFRKMIDETLEWFDDVQDPWWQAFFLNLAGISRFQSQEMDEGMAFLRQALLLFEQTRDLRGQSVVGGNLGTAMLLEGLRSEGREVLEQAAEASEKLGNYHNAVGQFLTVAKSYLDEKHHRKAMEYLQRAELLSCQVTIDDPIIHALFCYLYSRIDRLDKAKRSLDALRSKVKRIPKKTSKRADITTLLWNRFAESVHALIQGNLNDAMAHIDEGLNIADKYGHYDLSLEFSHLSLEILLKRYLLNPTAERIHEALYLMEDMQLLVRHIETPYYTTIFQLVKGYLLLALLLPSEAKSSLEAYKETAKSVMNADQEMEYALFEKRVTELLGQTNIIGGSIWLTKDYLSTLFVTEALRLLSNLQFQQAATGQPILEQEKLPATVMLLRNDGMSLFTYKFQEASEGAPDDQVISSFLMAINSFAKEMFGSSNLRKIDQGNALLLLEPISSEFTIVLVAKEETYSLRRKIKLFARELKKLDLEIFKDSVFMFSEDDPIFIQLKELVTSIFAPSNSSSTTNGD